DITSDSTGRDFEEIVPNGTLSIPTSLNGVENLYMLVGSYAGPQTAGITLTGIDNSVQTFTISIPDFFGKTTNTSGANYLSQTVFQTNDLGSAGTGNSITGATGIYDMTELTLALSSALSNEQLENISIKSAGSNDVLFFGLRSE